MRVLPDLTKLVYRKLIKTQKFQNKLCKDDIHYFLYDSSFAFNNNDSQI